MKIATLDFETDPFLYGRTPRPFAAGFYDGITFTHFWGDDAADRLVAHLDTQSPMVIYAHNGGKFDFFYILKYLQNPIKIIGGRIVEARLGKHTLRDSYAILPVPLATYEKTDIDYSMFEREVRDTHKEVIVSYLRDDCVYLYELVAAFFEKFGARLTIASTAMAQLRKIHKIVRGTKSHDTMFRKFYFGGRVECFRSGVFDGSYIIADVNSMYPYAMACFDHPDGPNYSIRTHIDLDDPRLVFAQVDATSINALPLRLPDGSLSFPHTRSTFYATAHELRAGVETGRLRIHTCITAYYCAAIQRFDAFVQAFTTEKIQAEARGDKQGRLFAKLVMNSAYGKFAQNPDNFYEYTLRRPHEPLPKDADLFADYGYLEVWRRPSDSDEHAYFDVAIAASVTGAARAELLRAVDSAEDPLYCDTDSLIARRINASTHASRLGAWRIEHEVDRVAIAGKKLYACSHKGLWVKYASKGARLSPENVVDIANGSAYKYMRDTPTFSLKGARFVQRTIRRTA